MTFVVPPDEYMELRPLPQQSSQGLSDGSPLKQLLSGLEVKGRRRRHPLAKAVAVLRERNVYGHKLSRHWTRILKVMRFSAVLANQ